jgi:hypothetical protein
MIDPHQLQIVSRSTRAEMAREATRSERKKVHLLLHDGHGDQVQRLIIVTQPGTYVRPPRKPQPVSLYISSSTTMPPTKRWPSNAGSSRIRCSICTSLPTSASWLSMVERFS